MPNQEDLTKDQTFYIFFCTLPLLCLFLFRCLKLLQFNEYNKLIKTGTCVEKDKYCKHKRQELRNARLRAQNLWDEYEDWIWRTNRLKQRAMVNPDAEDAEVRNDKWQRAKKLTFQIKRRHKIIRRHANSLKERGIPEECDVHIKIQNRNDMKPEFDQKEYYAKLKEGYLGLAMRLRIHAVHADAVSYTHLTLPTTPYV